MSESNVSTFTTGNDFQKLKKNCYYFCCTPLLRVSCSPAGIGVILVSLLLNLNLFNTFSSVFMVNFEQVMPTLNPFSVKLPWEPNELNLSLQKRHGSVTSVLSSSS